MDEKKEFPYFVRAYYADNVKRPKHPGELAIETKHRTLESQAMEVSAAESRKDIGRVEKGARW